MAKELMHAAEYLRHVYTAPAEVPALPLADEEYLAAWGSSDVTGVLPFLQDQFHIDTKGFTWEKPAEIRLIFTGTLAGRLPVICTSAHPDFCNLASLLNGRPEAMPYPSTVNACMMQARDKRIYHHRVLLMNAAPYSNVAAERLGLTAADWLEKSGVLRLRHECAHYETLRLFGGMQNHALDEITADAMGQIAAFGDFSARRQRILFGLQPGAGQCDGRLTFYTQKVIAAERPVIYRRVDEWLDPLEQELRQALTEKKSDYELLCLLAGRPLL